MRPQFAHGEALHVQGQFFDMGRDEQSPRVLGRQENGLGGFGGEPFPAAACVFCAGGKWPMRGDQMPVAATTISVRMVPWSVTTAWTRPLARLIPVTVVCG